MNESATIRLDIPAEHRYLNVLSQCIDAVLARVDGLADLATTSYNLQLAAQEICTNIVEHAYEGRPQGRIGVTLTLEDGPRRMLIELQDTGRSFDLAAAPEPNLDDAQVHGYGLFLARSLTDDLGYVAHPHGNHWRLVKYL